MIARSVQAIRRRWRQRQRDLDLQILWPRLKGQAAGDLAKARHAFAYHCHIDKAWSDLTVEQVAELISTLD